MSAVHPFERELLEAVLRALELLAESCRAGVDVSLDVHGDETLPHVFVDGCDMDPNATPAQVAGVARFKAELLRASPAFQTKVGYPSSYAGDAAPGA